MFFLRKEMVSIIKQEFGMMEHGHIVVASLQIAIQP
jgi:hypothetical protein